MPSPSVLADLSLQTDSSNEIKPCFVSIPTSSIPRQAFTAQILSQERFQNSGSFLRSAEDKRANLLPFSSRLRYVPIKRVHDIWTSRRTNLQHFTAAGVKDDINHPLEIKTPQLV